MVREGLFKETSLGCSEARHQPMDIGVDRFQAEGTVSAEALRGNAVGYSRNGKKGPVRLGWGCPAIKCTRAVKRSRLVHSFLF